MRLLRHGGSKMSIVCWYQCAVMPATPEACTAVQLWKRNVVIRDDSGSSVEITFWGGYAQDPGDALQEVCKCATLQCGAADSPTARFGIC